MIPVSAAEIAKLTEAELDRQIAQTRSRLATVETPRRGQVLAALPDWLLQERGRLYGE